MRQKDRLAALFLALALVLAGCEPVEKQAQEKLNGALE